MNLHSLNQQGELVASIDSPQSCRLRNVIFSPLKDDVVYVSTTNGVIFEYNHQTATFKGMISDHSSEISGLTFSHDGSRLYTSSDGGHVNAWDTDLHEIVWSVQVDPGVSRLAFFNDELLVGINQHPVTVLSSTDGAVKRVLSHTTTGSPRNLAVMYTGLQSLFDQLSLL